MKQKKLNVKELRKFLSEQFKDASSDIQLLMAKDYAEVDYYSERWFQCSDYGMVFKAQRDSATNTIELDFLSPLPKTVSMLTVLDLSSGNALKNELHYFESMQFVNETLKFSVEQYCFISENYRILLKNDANVWKNELSFLLNEKAVMHSTSHFEFRKSDIFFSSCRVKMRKPGVAYHVLDMKNNVFSELKRIHWESAVDSHTKSKLSDLFAELVSKPIKEWFLKELCCEIEKEFCL